MVDLSQETMVTSQNRFRAGQLLKRTYRRQPTLLTLPVPSSMEKEEYHHLHIHTNINQDLLLTDSIQECQQVRLNPRSASSISATRTKAHQITADDPPQAKESNPQMSFRDLSRLRRRTIRLKAPGALPIRA